MTIKLTRPQADAVAAMKRGASLSPPLPRAVMAALETKGIVRQVSAAGGSGRRFWTKYELTEEGERY